MITYLDRHGTIRDAASDGPQSGIVSIHAVVLSSIPEGPVSRYGCMPAMSRWHKGKSYSYAGHDSGIGLASDEATCRESSGHSTPSRLG